MFVTTSLPVLNLSLISCLNFGFVVSLCESECLITDVKQIVTTF